MEIVISDALFVLKQSTEHWTLSISIIKIFAVSFEWLH